MSEFKEEEEQLIPSFLSKDNFIFEDPVFQYSPTPLLLIDKNGKVLVANPQFSYLYDYQTEDLIDKKIDTILTFAKDDYKNYLSYLTNPIQEVRSLEAVLTQKDHSTVEVEILGYPFFTSKKHFLGNILTFKDISLRKYNERLSKILFNISRTANTNIALSDLYDIIHGELNQIIFAENFHIALWDKGKNQTIFPYFIDEKHELGEENDKPSFLKSLANYIIENGKPLLVDYAQILKLTKTGHLESTDMGKLTQETCWLGVPLKIGIHLTGCMSVAGYSMPNIYSDRDINSMIILSEVIVAAIERKLAEKEIHQNQEKFASLFISNPLAAMYSDINHIVRDINPKFTEVFGYTRKDIIGKHIEQVGFFPSIKKMEGKELSKNSYQSFLKNYETYRRAKDGRNIPIQMSASQVRIKGELQGFMSLYDDISEKKKAEAEIRQNQERFESLFRSNPLAAVYVDCNDIIIDINPRFTELFGYNKKDVLRKDINKIGFYPPEKKAEGESLAKTAALSTSVKFETVRRSKEGKDIPVQISTSQVKIKDENPGLIVLYEDITKKKQAGEEIRQNQERFESLFRSNPLAALYLDKEDRVLDANPQFTELFGYTREEMLGKHLMQLNFYPSDKIKEGKDLDIKTRPSGLFKHKTYRRAKRGKDIPVQISTSQVKIKGQVQGFVALYQDITEQKQNEALQQALYNISQAANAPITISQLYRNIHNELKKIINATNFYIALIDEEKDVISFVYYSDEQDDDFSPIDLNLKDTLTGYLIKQQRSLILNYNQIHGLVLEKKIGIYGPLSQEICWLGTPLRIERKVIGAMVVQDYHNPTCYSEKDIKLMEIVATQAATALDRKLSEEKIIYISFHDSLTGLYNRAYFEEELKRMNDPRFYPLSVAMMDVNGLKAINDTFGHSQGDKLLKNLAILLKRNSREADVLARLGGDEFAIILPNTAGSSAEVFCQRIANDCQQNNFEPLYLNPNISIGFSTQEGKLSDYEAILREADHRMYQNKLLNVKRREKYLLDAFLAVLSTRDIHTEKHSQRMLNIANKIGQKMDLSPYDLGRLRLLVLLHDIGKIGIPENILFKVEPLTEAEWQILKNHPNIGYRIAKNIPDFSSIANEILYHHERWDGTGYPAGLKEKEIPLLSRIIGLVDAFDAMQSERTYKKPLSQKEVMEEFRANTGTQFDPELVKIFYEIIDQNLLK